MQIENTTPNHINIALGVAVLASSTSPVELDMQDFVRSSPLVADYVASGALIIHETPTAASVPSENATPSTTVVEDKVGAAQSAKK